MRCAGPVVVPGVAGHGVVEAVARAADGEAFFVEQLADAADQQYFVVLVVAAVAAAPAPAADNSALKRELRELLETLRTAQ